MRLFFILFFLLILGYLLFQGRAIERSSEKPAFLRADDLVLAHDAEIKMTIHSNYRPDSLQLEILKKDYNALWAHLNHLYATNDIIAGKEYYTESWFRQLAAHFDEVRTPAATRIDKYHELHIENWSRDGLLCTAIDNNVVFTYEYPDQQTTTSKATLAVVLLYQGDHWRIDAMKVISETIN